jgi:hypothetical protein
MNAEYEKQLEAGVRRELKTLGALEAPPEIARHVMRVIAQRAASPWYRRAWQTWPLAFRTASFASLFAAFSLLCVGNWWLVHFASRTSAVREVSGWFSLTETVWSAVNALITALVLAFRSLGPSVLLGSVVMLLVCYAACVGLGTVYLRLAFARR